MIVGVGLATICNFGNNLAQTPLNTQLADYAWAPSNDGDAGAYRYRRPFWLPAELRDWLDAHAQALDEGAEDPASVLPRLAEAGVFRLGVPASQGGLEGSDAGDAIEAVSQLAEHSVAAAFVAWGQRVFIEYLLHSPNQALARDWTGPLLRGELAGATALSTP